jgi:hypothetical protein
VKPGPSGWYHDRVPLAELESVMKRTLSMMVIVASLGLASCGRDEPAARDAAPPAGQAASRAGSPELLALLPARDEAPGWTASKAPRSFDADSLWELINGAADGFIAYGVVEVVAADYKLSATGDDAVVEIYRMKDPLNAFGKYADERYPGYEFIDVGNEGYSGGNTVNFWKGPFYVKITAFEQKDTLRQELVKLARSIAGKVASPGAEPPELSSFPTENQVPHTAKYLPKDVLAQSYFTNGFEAQYKAGAKESKLVLVPMASPAAAREALGRYRDAVSQGKGAARALRAPGDEGFAGEDSFYGAIVAARRDRFIAVALGAVSEDAGRRQVADILREIK